MENKLNLGKKKSNLSMENLELCNRINRAKELVKEILTVDVMAGERNPYEMIENLQKILKGESH